MKFGRLRIGLLIGCLSALASTPSRAQHGSEPFRLPPPDIERVPGPARAASKSSDPLLRLVDQAIAETCRRKLTAGKHTPWQVVHGILALRWDCRIMVDGEDASAIEWIFSGQTHEGQPLWEKTAHGGRGHPFTKPYAFEGHPTQFLGYMAMAQIPLEYEIQADKGVITIRDIITDAQMTVKEGPEITWTLWALSTYLDPAAEWQNAKGEAWSIERLVALEVKDDVNNSACGGCHGLFALAYSRNRKLAEGEPLSGVWLDADQKVRRHIEIARQLQNSDGSFSSNHFKGPGFSRDFMKRIATSGHQLEWLMIAMPQRRMEEAWIRRAVENVANDLLRNRREPADCGPMFHAVHSLMLYRQRMQPGSFDPERNSPVKLAERKPLVPDLVRVPAPPPPPATAEKPAASAAK